MEAKRNTVEEALSYFKVTGKGQEEGQCGRVRMKMVYLITKKRTSSIIVEYSLWGEGKHSIREVYHG